MRQTFRKEEKLCSKVLINKLFELGKSFTVYPLRVVWMEIELENSYPVQLAISVPKRKIKKAVDRNRLKRRIREAYRKNKQLLYEPLKKNGRQIAVIFIYLPHQEMEYKALESKILVILQRLISEG